MTYNLYLQFNNGENNIFAISRNQVEKIANVYKKGLSSFTINHLEYGFKSVHHIAIFENENNHTAEQLDNWADGSSSFGYNAVIQPGSLITFGKNVTSEFLEDEVFGYEKQKKDIPKILAKNGDYVNAERLVELRKLKSTAFDLSKVIRFCEEINDNWERGNFYSVGLLGRSIINHIPPVFGPYTTFDQVVANGSSSSFKKNAKSLNESLRSIADSYTHHIIRKKDTLPNEQQVDFRANLDILLSEIIRILHL